MWLNRARGGLKEAPVATAGGRLLLWGISAVLCTRLRHCHKVHKLISVGPVAGNRTQFSCMYLHLTFSFLYASEFCGGKAITFCLNTLQLYQRFLFALLAGLLACHSLSLWCAVLVRMACLSGPGVCTARRKVLLCGRTLLRKLANAWALPMYDACVQRGICNTTAWLLSLIVV